MSNGYQSKLHRFELINIGNNWEIIIIKKSLNKGRNIVDQNTVEKYLQNFKILP